MKLKSGYPFWLVKDGLPYNYPKLDQDLDIEVAILGAGITGALVRHELQQHGISCVALDARTIGLGSSCASTALLQYEIDTPLHKLTDMVGKDHAQRAYQLCGAAIDELQDICRRVGYEEFTRRKSLFYAAYKKDVAALKKEFEARQDAGFDVRYLDADTLAMEFGVPGHSAILSDQAAVTNAYGLTHALLQHGKRDKFPIYDRTPIVDIKHHKSGVTLRSENGYTIRARYLVYATGYEVVNYIAEPIVKLKSTYAIISEQHDEKDFWKDEVLIWNTANPYLYMRTTPDNRIIIGGRDEDFYNPKKRDAIIDRKAAQLQQDFKKIFPKIPFDMEFSWTGTFGETKDGLPYIGAYDLLPNGFFALGFGGNGITFSVTAARIIRELLQGKTVADAQIFRFGR